jgi:predicted metal-dependent phosphoesterase TrpH
LRKYRIELHSHTSEVSPCGKITAQEMIELYVQKGYDGIVITDHFTGPLFHDLKDTKDILDRFCKGYNNALSAAQDRIKVYLGAEVRLDESYNDYLVFGNVLNFLKHGKELFGLSLKEFYYLAKEYDLAVFQAHPFRDHMKPAPKEYVDGIEVYNLHTEHESRNYKAVDYARKNNMLGISGTDCHKVHHVGRGGIFTDFVPADEKELKDLILSKNFDLKF